MRQHLSLAPDARAPAAARGLVTRMLAGTRSQADVDSAALLTSELVTNAVLHGGQTITLTVEDRGGAVRVTVVDDGAGTPAVRLPSPGDGAGRGLQLVDQIATRWGVDALGLGKGVWFEL
jgi:anti-sigma regulatory factor (Ser/Thr protein kinase)